VLGVAALAGLGALLLAVALRGVPAMRVDPLLVTGRRERSP
jgi:hypothetical protein